MLLTLGSHKIPQSVRNLPPPPPLQSPGVKDLISIWNWDLITFPKRQARSRKRNKCLHDRPAPKLMMAAISNFCGKTWLYDRVSIIWKESAQSFTTSQLLPQENTVFWIRSEDLLTFHNFRWKVNWNKGRLGELSEKQMTVQETFSNIGRSGENTRNDESWDKASTYFLLLIMWSLEIG